MWALECHNSKGYGQFSRQTLFSAKTIQYHSQNTFYELIKCPFIIITRQGESRNRRLTDGQIVRKFKVSNRVNSLWPRRSYQ